MKLSQVPETKTPPEKQIFGKKERASFKELDAKELEGHWILPDSREMVNKQLIREILTLPRLGSHWGVQAMCDAVLRKYVGTGMYRVATQICNRCVTYQQINKRL